MSRTKKGGLYYVRKRTQALKKYLAAEQVKGDGEVKTEPDVYSDKNLDHDLDDKSTSESRPGIISVRQDETQLKKLRRDNHSNISKLTAAKQAWRQTLGRAKLIVPTAERPHSWGRDTGLCTCGSFKGCNWIVAAVLGEIHNFRQINFKDKLKNAPEGEQLQRLQNFVTKKHKAAAGVPDGRTMTKNELQVGVGNREPDAKLLQAALDQIVDLRRQSQSRLLGKSVRLQGDKTSDTIASGTGAAALAVDSEKPSTACTDSATMSEEPFLSTQTVTRFSPSENLSFSKPFSVYASTPASPFATLHKVQSGRVTNPTRRPSKIIPNTSSIPDMQPIDGSRCSTPSPTPLLTSSTSYTLSKFTSTSTQTEFLSYSCDLLRKKKILKRTHRLRQSYRTSSPED